VSTNVGPARQRLLGVGLALAVGCTSRTTGRAPGPATGVSARVTREETVLRRDGVTIASRLQEHFLRDGDRVWIERVVSAKPHREEAQHRDEIHDWSILPRLVTRGADGRLSLQFIRRAERQVVDVEPPEYDSVGFDPSWSDLTELYPRDDLARLRRVGQTEGETEVYEGDDARSRVRVEWSPRLALALRFDSVSVDGALTRRVSAAPEPWPARSPWQDLEGFVHKDLNDFRD
jgi:hypothetical protein